MQKNIHTRTPTNTIITPKITQTQNVLCRDFAFERVCLKQPSRNDFQLLGIGQRIFSAAKTKKSEIKTMAFSVVSLFAGGCICTMHAKCI